LFVSQIANRLFGLLAAWVAGGMMAVYPFFVAYSMELYSETLFTFLLTAAILILFPYPDRAMPSFKASLIGGLLIGLSTLTRELGLMLLPAITLWFWFSQRRLAARWLIALWLVSSIVIGSWTTRNYLIWGKFILITSHTFTNVIHSLVNDHRYSLDGVTAEIPSVVPSTVDNPFAYLAGVDQVKQEEYARSLVLSYCKIQPTNCLTAWGKNLLKLVSPIIANRTGWIVWVTSLSHLFVYVLGVVGIIQFSRIPNKGPVFFLVCWFGLCLGINSIAHVEIRYRIPIVDPYLIILGSHPTAQFFHTQLSRLSRTP
jgi:4-amino-4-deoxy-L-arabinose transferase-like glycosyltransferase